jgi:hypothetical protein
MAIMKQLIESMIGDYLNESYEDDLVESIFEEVSEETWEAIQEAILNELSPELLQHYGDKAYARAKKLSNSKTKKSKKEFEKRDDGWRMAHRKTNALAPGRPRSAKVKAPGSNWELNARSDMNSLSADEFQKRHKMAKADFERKYNK